MSINKTKKMINIYLYNNNNIFIKKNLINKIIFLIIFLKKYKNLFILF